MRPQDAVAVATPEHATRVLGWRESRFVLLLGLALTTLVAAAVLWVGWIEYRNHVSNARDDHALIARVLEDHATLTVDTAALTLSALADRVAARPQLAGGDLAGLLQEAQTGLVSLRGVALVDQRGTLLASTDLRDVRGSTVPVDSLGPWPAEGETRLGRFLPGRSLGDLSANSRGRLTVPDGIGFIPLSRTVRTPEGGRALLVGLLNPDAFSNYQTLVLDDARAVGVLSSYAGDVLAATPAAAAAPLGRTLDHEVFRQRLAGREHEAYEGVGLGGDAQIIAFRASRIWPLVVLVEHPLAAVRADWWSSVRAAVGVFTAAVLLLGAMTVVAWHGLRARERTRTLLDAAQAEIVRSERELSVTMKSVQELIFRTDASGVITYVNARWTTVGGTTPQQAIGTDLAALAIPAQRDEAQALFAPRPTTGMRNAQICVKPAGGAQERLFDVAVVPLVEDGRIAGFAGSAVDVTERVTSQRKLQTQLAITALMLEISPLPLSVRDLQGRYLNVNQAWEAFTGIRRKQILGRASAPHLAAAERLAHQAQDRQLLVGGGRVRYEANVRHADGSRRDVVLEKVLMPGDSGAPAAILAVLMDVSEFRAAERATRDARDAAEEASRAKSEFVANISHELRTPLQSILGFSELGVLRGRDQPKLAAMFTDIHEAGRRMLALVNDLLDVAKLESAVGTFHLERTDLRPLVADKSVHLRVALPEQPLTAKVDPLRFQQVVRNVLANAIRFSPPQGCIQLDGSTTPQAEIRLRIADQGPGIPAAELDRIFDAFVQSSTTKDGSGGTGLGLTICRKIVEIHGGRITAENLAGGGAAFSIHLPARSAAETVAMPLR